MMRIQEGFPGQVLVRMPVESLERLRQLPLCRALYPTDIGHYPEARNHLVRRDESCPNFIVIYCLGGQGYCAFGGRRLDIAAGQAIMIPAHTSHEYGTAPAESWRIYWLHFNGSESAGLFDLLTEDGLAPTAYLPRPGSIVAAFDDTLRWSRRGHTRADLVALSGACARLLALIVESKRPSASRAREVEERLRGSIDRMRETLRHPLSLEQLAEEAALSIPHYCSVFRKQTGSSPMQLYTQLRIQHACQLLHDTELEIRVVAEEAGYADAYYFSRAFKRVMGLAPSAYRHSCGKGARRAAKPEVSPRSGRR